MINAFKKFFQPDELLAQMPLEEQRKRVYVLVNASIAVPIFLFFGLIHLCESGSLETSWADLLMAAFLAVFILRLRKTVDGGNLYRTGMFALSAILLYNIVIGLYEGTDVLWFYVYPLIVFYLFGIREGLLWTAPMLMPVFVILFFPDLVKGHHFSQEFNIRFVISMLIITFVSGFLESLRQHYYEQLQQQKDELTRALEEVKMLSGLLPICSSCKKIRDDKGYWNQLESYIEKHSDASFSHGLCTECSDKIYGSEEWYVKMKKEKNKP